MTKQGKPKLNKQETQGKWKSKHGKEKEKELEHYTLKHKAP